MRPSPSSPVTGPSRAPARIEGDYVPTSLRDLDRAVDACGRCPLWRDAIQGVAGEGPARARLMVVGEQPGDQEDQAGRPFVGPAGRILDRALDEIGLDRKTIFVTNAVKHFKHEQRGKRRLHKTPAQGEIVACRWWLDHERRLIRPKAILAMGGSAAFAVMGRKTPVMASRGRALELPDGTAAVITIHPSYLLRIRDEADRARQWGGFTADIALAAELAA